MLVIPVHEADTTQGVSFLAFAHLVIPEKNVIPNDWFQVT